MGRREKSRILDRPPRYFRFNSEESPTDLLSPVTLQLDEYEALRLSDRLGYDHMEAASIMGISRPTFTRLLKKARGKLAEFLTDGGSLEIRGGEVMFSGDVYCCRSCHRPFKWTGGGTPECPRCGGDKVLQARASCRHDCRCCEEADELC